MIIKIKSIEGNGFLSFLKSFHFNLSQYEGQTVQIDGRNNDDEYSYSNGSGKSSLLESINWGLFGKLCRRSRYKDEVIHKTAKQAQIKITIDVDGVEYLIDRRIHRKKEPDLYLFKNGEEILRGAVYSTKQIELEKIIGMGFVAFQCSVMFGRDFMNFPDLKPAERAKTLTDIRGLDKYTDAAKIAGDLAKTTGNSLQGLALSLQNEEGKLAGVRLKSFKQDIEEFEQQKKLQIKAVVKEIVDNEHEIKKLRKEQEQEKRKITEEKNKKQAEANKLQLYIQAELINLKKREEEHTEEIINLQSQLSKCSFDIEHYKREHEEISRAGEGPCPFCHQMISGKYLNRILEDLDSKRIPIEKVFLQLQQELKEAKAQKLGIEKARTIHEDNKHNLNNIKMIIMQLEYQMESLASDIKVKKQEEKIKELQRRQVEIENQENPFLEMEAQRQAQIKQIGMEIRNIKTHIQEYKLQKQYYDAWSDGFKKIRMMVFDTMTEHLETIIRSYLTRYSSELNVFLTTERETRSGTIKDEFNISVVDSNGNEVSYEMYSGGERQKVRLAISRALAHFIEDDCGRSFNFIAFDEPNDALDDAGKEVNFATFSEMAESREKAVLVTDHDASFKNRFDHNILVIKEKGESRIG